MIPRTIPEPFYTEAFLLTRAYFISSRALLNRLIHFFLYAPPSQECFIFIHSFIQFNLI